MHGELGALAHGPGDQPQPQQGAGQGGEGAAGVSISRPGVEIAEFHRASPGRKGNHAHQQQHIAHPFGEEGIAGCCHHQGLGIPEAHQQIGGEGEHLQEEVAHEQAAAQHHAGQGPFKEAHQGIETGQGPFLIEVTEGINLAQQAHAGDQLKRRQVGEREIEADAQVEIGGLEPAEFQVLGADCPNLLEDQAAVDHSQQGHQQVEVGGRTRAVAPKPAGRPRQRQHHATEPVEGDHPDQLDRQWQGFGGQGE